MAYLGLFSDILLLAATLGMAIYCRSLAIRLRAFNAQDTGIGGTLTALSRRVDDLMTSIDAAEAETASHSDQLQALIEAADDRIGRLELLLAGLEDIEADVSDRIDHIDPPEDAIVMPAFRAARSDPERKFIR